MKSIVATTLLILQANGYYSFGSAWLPYGDKPYTYQGLTQPGWGQRITQVTVRQSANGCISGVRLESSSTTTEGMQNGGTWGPQEQAPPAASCSAPSTCLVQALSSTQRIVKVKITTNQHFFGGCVDGIYFKTSDNFGFGCNARPDKTAFPDNNPLTKLFDMSPNTNELADFSFYAYDDCKLYSIELLSMYNAGQTDTSTIPLITLDVSAITGTKNLITDTASSSIGVTLTSEYTNIDYSLSVTPTPVTANLITLSTTPSQQITFSPSNNILDAGVYTISIKASFTGLSTQIATSASATFEYVDPCKTATVTATSHPTIATTVGATASSSTALWYDSVSGSAAIQLCGPFTVYSSATSTSTTYNDASMSTDFVLSTSTTQSILTASPKLSQEVGTLTLSITVCLANYPTQCVVINSVVQITNCVLTAVKVVQSADGADLSAQSYTLGGPQLDYALTIQQTPNCGYASSGWTVTATGSQPANFQTIDATGNYKILPTSQENQKGTYTIQVSAVVLNGVTYGPTGLNVLVSPSSFTLTVVSPCASTTFILPSVADMSTTLNVVTATQQVSPFKDSISLLKGDSTGIQYCGQRQYSISSTLGTASEALSASDLYIDKTTGLISIQTSNQATVGIHAVSVIAQLISFPDVKSAPLTFVITVLATPNEASYIPDRPPYFEPPLPAQILQNQCKNAQFQPWSFSVPSITDQNNSPVTMEIQFDQSFFSFDKTKKTIKQIRIADMPTTKTIKFTLRNSLNFHSTFSMKIVFGCETKQTSNTQRQNTSEFNWTEIAANLTRKSIVQKQQLDPDVNFKSISYQGVTVLAFTNSMFVPPLQEIQSATFYNESIKQDQPAVLITVIPSRYSNLVDLNFSYNITSYTHKSLEIQLTFENPLLISAQLQPDVLCVQFTGSPIFFDSQGQTLQPWKTLLRQIPRQLANDQASSTFVSLVKFAQTATYSMMAVSFALNVLLSAGLSQLLSMINTQQIIVMMPLFNQQMPENAGYFYGILMNIASFNLLPTDTFYDTYLKLKDYDQGPLTLNFEELGYSSVYFLYNMGTLILSFVSVILLITASIYLTAISKLCTKLVRLNTKLSNFLYWNYVIQILFEAYSVLCMCVLINLKYLHFTAPSLVFNNSIMFFFCGVCFLLPIAVGVGLSIKYKSLDSVQSKAKYGSLYSNLSFGMGRKVATVSTVYLLRRLALAVSVVYQKFFVVQFLVLFLGLIAQFYILGTRPHLDEKETNNEYFNECIVWLTMNTFMCFTNLVQDVESQYFMGYVSSFFVTCHLAINLFLIASVGCRSIVLNIKKGFAKLRARKNKQIKAVLGHHRRSSSTSALQHSSRSDSSIQVTNKKLIQLESQIVKNVLQRADQRFQSIENEMIRGNQDQTAQGTSANQSVNLFDRNAQQTNPGLGQLQRLQREREYLKTLNRNEEKRKFQMAHERRRGRKQIVSISNSVDAEQLDIEAELVSQINLPVVKISDQINKRSQNRQVPAEIRNTYGVDNLSQVDRQKIYMNFPIKSQESESEWDINLPNNQSSTVKYPINTQQILGDQNVKLEKMKKREHLHDWLDEIMDKQDNLSKDQTIQNIMSVRHPAIRNRSDYDN